MGATVAKSRTPKARRCPVNLAVAAACSSRAHSQALAGARRRSAHASGRIDCANASHRLPLDSENMSSRRGGSSAASAAPAGRAGGKKATPARGDADDGAGAAGAAADGENAQDLTQFVRIAPGAAAAATPSAAAADDAARERPELLACVRARAPTRARFQHAV